MSSTNDYDVTVTGGGAPGESADYDVIVLGAGPVASTAPGASPLAG
jgi:hypothetical protein